MTRCSEEIAENCQGYAEKESRREPDLLRSRFLIDAVTSIWVAAGQTNISLDGLDRSIPSEYMPWEARSAKRKLEDVT